MRAHTGPVLSVVEEVLYFPECSNVLFFSASADMTGEDWAHLNLHLTQHCSVTPDDRLDPSGRSVALMYGWGNNHHHHQQQQLWLCSYTGSSIPSIHWKGLTLHLTSHCLAERSDSPALPHRNIYEAHLSKWTTNMFSSGLALNRYIQTEVSELLERDLRIPEDMTP